MFQPFVCLTADSYILQILLSAMKPTESIRDYQPWYGLLLPNLGICTMTFKVDGKVYLSQRKRGSAGLRQQEYLLHGQHTFKESLRVGYNSLALLVGYPYKLRHESMKLLYKPWSTLRLTYACRCHHLSLVFTRSLRLLKLRVILLSTISRRQIVASV